MAHALPVTKLAGLLVKTLAKPLSKRIKHKFSRYETSQRVLVNIGQLTHTVTSRLTIWSAGYKVRSIKKLEDEKALSAGADFVGESFVLCVSIGVLLYEYNSSTEKARIKDQQSKARARAERQELRRKLRAIDVRLAAVEDFVIQQSNTATFGLPTVKYREPHKSKIVPLIDDDDNDGIDDSSSSSSGNAAADNNEENRNTNIRIQQQPQQSTGESSSSPSSGGRGSSDSTSTTSNWLRRLLPPYW